MNLFNRMMNNLEADGLIQSLKKFITLFGKRLVIFVLVQQSKFPSITKTKKKII